MLNAICYDQYGNQIQYFTQAGNANTATNAVNASMINNHRVVTMSATDFDTAVKDENTVYLVGEFS